MPEAEKLLTWEAALTSFLLLCHGTDISIWFAPACESTGVTPPDADWTAR
jgi:hypothetical protein